MNSLFETIKDARKTRILYSTDHYILEEGIKENKVKIPKEAAYVILNINNTKLALENKNISFKISNDVNDRLISFDLNGIGMKINLKTSFLHYEMIGDENLGYFISISEMKFSKDLLINSEEELYKYPIVETKIKQTNEGYIGQFYSILAPLAEKIKILEIEGSYLEVSSQLEHYILKYEKYAPILSILYCQEKNQNLLLTSEGVFKVYGVSEDGIVVCNLDNDSTESVIHYKDLFDVRAVDYFSASYIYKYKNKWYNIEDLDKPIKEILKDNSLSNWLKISSIIKENYNVNNYNIIEDYKDLYNDICNKIVKSKILSLKNEIIIINEDNSYSTFTDYLFDSYNNYIKFIFKNITKK